MADHAQAHELASATDRLVVQFLLRAGLVTAIILMALGAAVKVASGSLDAPAVGMFEIFSSEFALGDRLMALGVLALALTPAFRVIMLIVLWIKERDWRFVGVAIVVLITLTIAVALGGG